MSGGDGPPVVVVAWWTSATNATPQWWAAGAWASAGTGLLAGAGGWSARTSAGTGAGEPPADVRGDAVRAARARWRAAWG